MGISSIAISAVKIAHCKGFGVLLLLSYVVCTTNNWNGDNSYGSGSRVSREEIK